MTGEQTPDLSRVYFESEIRRLDAAISAEIELRRARREDDLRAQGKFEDSVTRRFDQVNEFRGALSDLGATMATKKDLTSVQERIGRNEGFQSRLAGALAIVALALPVLTAIFFKRL